MNKENRMTHEVDVSKPLSLAFQSLYSGLTNRVVIVAKNCPWPMNAWERPHGMVPLSSYLIQLLATAECSTREQKRPTLSPDVILPFKENRQALGGELMTLTSLILDRVMASWWVLTHSPYMFLLPTLSLSTIGGLIEFMTDWRGILHAWRCFGPRNPH